MIFLFVGLAALFVLIGWGVHKKKWYFLISGYNMMSKEEKAKVDVEPLAKSLATMAYIIAVLMLVLGLGIQFENDTVPMVATALLIIVPTVFVIKGQKYYNGVSSHGSSKKSKKISIVISIITLAIVGIIVFLSMQPTKFEVKDNGFSISGMYGNDYEWDEIEQLTLMNQLPAIAMRTNGSAVGSKLKGNFKFKDGEKAVLFLDKQVKAYIRFEANGKIIILNEPTVEETNTLFEQLKQRTE